MGVGGPAVEVAVRVVEPVAAPLTFTVQVLLAVERTQGLGVVETFAMPVGDGASVTGRLATSELSFSVSVSWTFPPSGTGTFAEEKDRVP